MNTTWQPVRIRAATVTTLLALTVAVGVWQYLPNAIARTEKTQNSARTRVADGYVPPAQVSTHHPPLSTHPVPVVDCSVRPCQALGPAAPHPIWAVDSAAGFGRGEVGWDSRGMTDWQAFAQGEYVGHHRAPHVPEYRLRPGDELAFVYRRTREQLGRSYELQVGDVIRVESLTAGQGPATRQRGAEPQQPTDDITRDLTIGPDGTITLPLIGEVRAAGRSVQSLRDELEEKFKKFYRVPSITVTPVTVNTRLNDLLEAVDARAGVGGLQFEVTVTPAGTIMLPALGMVFVQGFGLDEVKLEVDARYDATIPGVEVTPVVTKRAPRFIYVVGEVATPGQFELQGPTSVIQAIALAGGWNTGANLRQVVVFRRGDDWRMLATMVDVRGALYARRPVPADDIWLNDSDVVLVPKTPIEVFDEFLEQYIIRGLYGAVPVEKIWGINFASTTALIGN